MFSKYFQHERLVLDSIISETTKQVKVNNQPSGFSNFQTTNQVKEYIHRSNPALTNATLTFSQGIYTSYHMNECFAAIRILFHWCFEDSQKHAVWYNAQSLQMHLYNEKALQVAAITVCGPKKTGVIITPHPRWAESSLVECKPSLSWNSSII